MLSPSTQTCTQTQEHVLSPYLSIICFFFIFLQNMPLSVGNGSALLLLGADAKSWAAGVCCLRARSQSCSSAGPAAIPSVTTCTSGPGFLCRDYRWSDHGAEKRKGKPMPLSLSLSFPLSVSPYPSWPACPHTTANLLICLHKHIEQLFICM